MREINVTTKTGFAIKDPSKPLIIRDERGLLFYSNEDCLPRIKKINIPGLGKFFIDQGALTQLQQPITWVVPRRPPNERALKDPFDFKIEFKANPHKCTIDFDKETITFDTSFLEATLPELYFILYHEFAHQFYSTEAFTDALAVNYMLAKGFNPEQIGTAHICTLSEKQYARKVFIVNRLINTHGN